MRKVLLKDFVSQTVHSITINFSFMNKHWKKKQRKNKYKSISRDIEGSKSNVWHIIIRLSLDTTYFYHHQTQCLSPLVLRGFSTLLRLLQSCTSIIHFQCIWFSKTSKDLLTWSRRHLCNTSCSRHGNASWWNIPLPFQEVQCFQVQDLQIAELVIIHFPCIFFLQNPWEPQAGVFSQSLRDSAF